MCFEMFQRAPALCCLPPKCVVMPCRANKDFALEQLSGRAGRRGLHRGALVWWAFSFRTQGSDFCKSLCPFSCAPSVWAWGRRGGPVVLLFCGVGLKGDAPRALPVLAAALRSLVAASSVWPRRLDLLCLPLPSVGLRAKEEVQALCKAVRATALPLRGLWCLIKHSI